jgi:hypothetical protein
MRKRLMNTFIVDGEKTPAYIIAHAQWQKSRGRKPSERVGAENNPRQALENAYRELATYRSSVGRRVCRVAGEMIILASFTKRPCSTTFNGIKIVASPSSTACTVIDLYYEAFDRRAEERRRFLHGSTAGRVRY